MKELFNNGISEVIYGNDLDVYTTNLSKFDRMMKRSMAAQRESLKNVAMPVTSNPEPTADLKVKVNALKKEAQAKAKAIKQMRRAEIANAKRARDVRTSAGMSADRASHEFNLAVKGADDRARTALAENRSMFKAKIQQTLRSGLQENLDYLKQVKAQIQLKVQEVERKIANTNDLMNSGKMSPASAEGIVRGYRKQITQLIKQMNSLTKRGQMATIDIHQKLGMISPDAAERLRDQKMKAFEQQAKHLTDLATVPGYTYDPIDAETGRKISKSDLERHITYLSKAGGTADVARITKIIKNMRMPGATKVVEVQIKMIPKARTLNQLAGDRVFSTTESQRITKNQHSLEIPSRAIAGEDQPNAKTFTPMKKPVTQSIRDLTRGVNALQIEWSNLYKEAVKAGKSTDIRLNMTIGSIKDLTNEVKESSQTGKNEEEVQNKLQMLKEEYLKAIKDLRRLTRRQ